MSMTLPVAQQRRDYGMEKLKRRRYEDAIVDFQAVTENLLVDTDQKAAVKMICFNQMALCYLELEDYDRATIASGESILLFDKMRPGEMDKKVHKKNDILFQPCHNAFVRRGQIFEKQKKYKEALSHYRTALTLTQRGEAKQRIQDVLSQFGIPAIDQEDPKLKPLSDIVQLDNLFQPDSLTNAFRGIIDVINNKPTLEQIQYWDANGISEALLGILNFNMQSEMNVDIALTITNYFMRFGATHAWLNSDVLIAVFNEYHDNTSIVSDLLTIFSQCPKGHTDSFARKDVIGHLMEAFDLEIKDDEHDKIVRFLFDIFSSNPNAVEYLRESKILDYLLQSKSKNSICLLSRLSTDSFFIEKIKTNGALDWVFDFLKEDYTSSLNINIATIICQQIYRHPEESEGFHMKDFAHRVFEEITPVYKANTKNYEVLNDLFMFILPFIKESPESVGPSNIITCAAAALMVTNSAKLIFSSLDILYECAKQGLIEQLTNSKIALTSAMKTLDKFPKNQNILEKTVAIACYMNHPNKEKLLQAALIQYPRSEILKPFAPMLAHLALEAVH